MAEEILGVLFLVGKWREVVSWTREEGCPSWHRSGDICAGWRTVAITAWPDDARKMLGYSCPVRYELLASSRSVLRGPFHQDFWDVIAALAGKAPGG